MTVTAHGFAHKATTVNSSHYFEEMSVIAVKLHCIFQCYRAAHEPLSSDMAPCMLLTFLKQLEGFLDLFLGGEI